MIPRQDPENDFFIENYQESAFNTIDFHRLHPQSQFNKYAYRIKKIMEQIMDLAIMHSSISSPQGRLNTQKRYEDLVDSEFRARLMTLAERYRKAWTEQRRFELKRKIAAINRTILDCKKTWERYAPPENWDR
ncbi:MAG: hypothetical protein ISS63_13665 [Desulfobacteraceae bacterium]|nr:hypothetical protein [Desulfobacteraceae bacterium]